MSCSWLGSPAILLRTLPFAAFLAVGYAALRVIQDRGVRSRWFLAALVLAILAAFVWLALGG